MLDQVLEFKGLDEMNISPESATAAGAESKLSQ